MRSWVYLQVEYISDDSRPKVNFGEYSCSSKLIEQDIDPGKRVLILNSDLIKGSVVHAHSKRLILLLDKDCGTPQCNTPGVTMARAHLGTKDCDQMW
jgi:hypothetical protein